MNFGAIDFYLIFDLFLLLLALRMLASPGKAENLDEATDRPKRRKKLMCPDS